LEIVGNDIVFQNFVLVCEKVRGRETERERHHEHGVGDDVDPVPDAAKEKGGASLKDLLGNEE
jgi:hypothetical protein